MDPFVSCHLFLQSVPYPLPEMNTAHVYRTTCGGLGWVVGISKSFLYISACVVQVPVFNLQLCGEKCFDSWFRMCTPLRFQEGFRQRDKACLFTRLCSVCSVAITHTPHCAEIPGFMKVSPIPTWGGFWHASTAPCGSKPVVALSLFPILYMILRKTVPWKAQEKLKLQWKSQL